MVEKAVIFDSSSIITLALNDMLSILKPLKESSGIKFFITPQIKKEIVDNPSNIKRFELEAFRILSLIKEGTLELMAPKSLEKDTYGILSSSNSLFVANGEKMRLFHEGEASCFALADILNEEYEVILAIDERNSRMLCENSENLRKLLERKLHTSVKMSKTDYFSQFSILRSSELLFVAYKKGLISLPVEKSKAIDALLYGAKFKGCSISYEEIEEAKKLI